MSLTDRHVDDIGVIISNTRNDYGSAREQLYPHNLSDHKGLGV